MKEKKRKHTQALQLMKELVSSAGLWEAEDTGSRPSDEYLHNLGDRRIDMYKEEPNATLDEPLIVEATAKLEEGPKGMLLSSWSTVNHLDACHSWSN